MKKILITGINSYVGNSFKKWVENSPGKYQVDKISVRDESWKNLDFSIYDSVLHVAGIAHVSTDPKMEELYYKINRDLTIDIAKKALDDGVKQFIFLSSIIVYGDNINNAGFINHTTIPKPSNFYGESKLQAEKGIQMLKKKNFNVAIIRPPMIYGKGSKGNYPKLANLARKIPIFPDFENQRSMLHIDNLTELIRLLVENREEGVFFPQNKDYVKTSELVRLIADVHGRKIIFTKIFNPLIKRVVNRVGIVNKVFGNLIYDKNMSNYHSDYCLIEFRESIIATELESGE